MCLKTLLHTVVFCWEENINILILDIDDQNMMCVIASKGSRLHILNLNRQYHQSVWFIHTVHLKNKSILDRVTFDIIS